MLKTAAGLWVQSTSNNLPFKNWTLRLSICGSGTVDSVSGAADPSGSFLEELETISVAGGGGVADAERCGNTPYFLRVGKSCRLCRAACAIFGSSLVLRRWSNALAWSHSLPAS